MNSRDDYQITQIIKLLLDYPADEYILQAAYSYNICWKTLDRRIRRNRAFKYGMLRSHIVLLSHEKIDSCRH